MALIIQKFGGSSVGTIERIKHVAQIIAQAVGQGHQVIVVVSAMGDETDRLLALLNQTTSEVPPREYAALLASGEQASSALVAAALTAIGISAQSYNAFQIKLCTELAYCKARVSHVDQAILERCLQQGIVPVVTGFQGINDMNELTTLGRGGSDITAVALSAFLKANECQIFTDVDGVFSVDPNLVADAQLLNNITYDEMLAFASLGARVLQPNSVEMARKYNVPLRVLSSFHPAEGTLIRPTQAGDQAFSVSGIAYVDDQVKVTLTEIAQSQAESIMALIQTKRLDMDMLWQHSKGDNALDMSFALPKDDLPELCRQTRDIHIHSGLAKVSVVGKNMQSHAGFSAQIMQLLGPDQIHIHSIVSTAVKVSILVDSDKLPLAVSLLHRNFASISVKIPQNIN